MGHRLQSWIRPGGSFYCLHENGLRVRACVIVIISVTPVEITIDFRYGKVLTDVDPGEMGEIHLQCLNCQWGRDWELEDCPTSCGTFTCTHENDAGVICYGQSIKMPHFRLDYSACKTQLLSVKRIRTVITKIYFYDLNNLTSKFILPRSGGKHSEVFA